MLKAVREAKLRTSWINPDAEYEAALERFVVDSLASPGFVKEVNDSVPRIARLGQIVSLSQALVKVASPGVPDYYQGTELFDFSLVDPDNRRPVDYEIRSRYLKEERPDPEALLGSLSDGRAKLHIIRKGLEVRRAHPALFQGPRYVPLHADSGREENIVAFALMRNGQALVAVAPRLFARLMGEDDLAPLGERIWGEAAIVLPESLRGEFTDVLTGETHSLHGQLPIAPLLARFPVALLVRA
jgi:(1->4)-alpha-D-glucan 1-alpha-D-glucosylmutase